MVYPLSALRAVALHSHALTYPLGHEPTPTPDAIYRLITTRPRPGTVAVSSDYRSLCSRTQTALGLFLPAHFAPGSPGGSF